MTGTIEQNAFVEGRRPLLRLGGRGSRVDVYADAARGQVVLKRVTRPRKEKTIGPNTRAVRKKAAQLGQHLVAHMLDYAAGRRSVEQEGPRPTGRLTVEEVWQLYLKTRLPGIPGDSLRTWNRRAVTVFLSDQKARKGARTMTVDSLVTVLQCARRLDAAGVFPFGAEIGELQPGEIERASLARIGEVSVQTIRTDLGRMRTAIRHLMTKWPKLWGDRSNPLAAPIEFPDTDGGEPPPEVGEDMAKAILAELKRSGPWRAWATCAILFHTGRRVGAVSGDREGLHLDEPPLTGDDLRGKPGGPIVGIVWRARAAKGRAYGRGDVEMPVTTPLSDILLEVMREHPNPLGSAHPLIWSPRDPSRAVSYAAISRAFRLAWDRVVEEIREREGEAAAKRHARQHGLGFHGFCRTTITTITAHLGHVSAAEYAGRSPATALRYKRTRPSEMLRAADTMANCLAEKNGPRSGEGGESSLAARHTNGARNDN